MKIILKNHNEEYAVREIVGSFFPKVKLEFTNDIPQNENYIYSEVQSNKKIVCIAFADGIKRESHIYNDVTDKTKIKKSIYECLSQITGITLPWGLLTGIRPAKIIREFRRSGGKNASDFLVTEYETEKSKAKLAEDVETVESIYIDNMYQNGISLYIGIPFCPTRCLYCSFTSQSIAFSNKLTEPYVEALKKEIKAISSNEFVISRKIETIYFGGGTPSALSSSQIDDILNCIEAHFNLEYVKEITFEAGRPDTICEDKLHVLLKHKVTRISINPQTVNDNTLKKIGRNHSSDDFFRSFELARSLGFSHINSDIIAGLPDETESDFEKTLDSLCGIHPESITVHTMSIKHGSYLDMNYDTYSPTAASTVNNMLSLAHERLKNLGMHPYYMYRQKNMLGNLENVGYCLPSHECIYNIYIMEEVQNIVALGAGGSTKLIGNNSIERVFNVKEVYDYIHRIDEMINRKIELFNKWNIEGNS